METIKVVIGFVLLITVHTAMRSSTDEVVLDAVEVDIKIEDSEREFVENIDIHSYQVYIETFAELAVKEMKRSGVPASITLSQGLLESAAGKSKLAMNNKNHFGIKCFAKGCEKGHCTNHHDDHHKDFFRVYISVEESFYDHSKFLKKKRYSHLFKLETTDYKSWAHGLKKAGYATDKRYAFKLIAIIERYELHVYDVK